MKEPFATGAIMKINTPAYRVHTATSLALEGLLSALLWLLPAGAHAQAIEAWVQLSAPTPDIWPGVALALDAGGNVVVCGPYREVVESGMDWLTTKYSSTGVPLWTNRYSGPVWGDLPSAVAVDASGNVFVTGFSARGDPPYGHPDFATIKYSSAGEPLWTNYYNGPADNSDLAHSVAVDTNGNVYVTGQSEIGRLIDPPNGDWPTNDCVTIKYSSAGVPLWTNRYYRPGDLEDVGRGVTLDASGNVSVFASLSLGGMGPSTFARITYSSAGALLQVKTYGSFGSWPRYAHDPSGNLIITSWDTQYDMYGDYKTVKYSNAGVALWTRRYSGSANDRDEPRAIAVDAGGNVVVTGGSGNGTNYCYATIKYSSAGVPLWTNRYKHSGYGDATPSALALDSGGNAFVTGALLYNLTNNLWIYAIATFGYSSSGLPLFTNLYVGPGNLGAVASSLAVDASGSVYVGGGAKTSDSTASFVTIKYVIPPIITRQPVSCTNVVGTTASFTVEAWAAAGATPLSYQWRRDGTNLVDAGNLSGVTTTNLLVADVQLADQAGYSVVVTNAYGSVTSVVAQLTVYVPPSPGRFTKLSYEPETGFSFIFREGTVGKSYRIQVSPSLEGGWVDWTSFNYTAPRLFTDLEAVGTSNRFYRAVSP